LSVDWLIQVDAAMHARAKAAVAAIISPGSLSGHFGKIIGNQSNNLPCFSRDVNRERTATHRERKNARTQHSVPRAGCKAALDLERGCPSRSRLKIPVAIAPIPPCFLLRSCCA
jgi:hypothetical protein